MNQIENLTDQQEAKLEEYYEKWLKIGMKTGECDKESAEKCIFEIYKNADLKKPKIIWTRSPFEAAMKARELGDKESNICYSAGYGNHDANWLGFYEFMRMELALKEETEELVPLMELAKHCGWWFPYDNICILSEFPLELHVDEIGNMHNLNDAAIRYKDGFEMFMISGLEVPEYIIKTKVEDFTKKMILSEENADFRNRIIHKIGIEKAVNLLGAETIDSLNSEIGGKYELLSIDYDGRGNKRPYLKMKSRSITADHIEGVKPGSNSVADAICYRNKLLKFIEPEMLS